MTTQFEGRPVPTWEVLKELTSYETSDPELHELLKRASDAVETEMRHRTHVIWLLGEALDEIWSLRGAAAFEATVTKDHLALRTFPVSRRKLAEASVARQQQSARGEVLEAYPHKEFNYGMRLGLTDAGADQLLTQGMWTAERPRTPDWASDI